MRRTSWTVGIAAPIAVLTAVAGVGLAAAALASPTAPAGAPDAAGLQSHKEPTTTTRTAWPTTTKTTRTKKVKGRACTPGCVLVRNDFETGAQGWVGAEGEALGVTTESAASGEQALAPVWINSSMGPSTTITSQRLLRPAGQTYLATVRFRQTGANNGKPVSIAVKGAEQVRTEAVAMSGQWQVLRAAFVPTSTTITITVVEGPGDPCRSYPAVMQAVSLDDFTLEVPSGAPSFTPAPTSTTTCPTPTPTPTPTQTATWCAGCTILTSTFEDGDTGGWVAANKVVLTRTKDAAASGSYGLSAQGLTYLDSPVLSVDSSILDARAGLLYETAARVRMAPGQPATVLRLYVSGAQTVWSTPTTVTADAWTTVRTQFVIGSRLATLDQLKISLGQQPVQSNCANPSGVDVLMDDATLSVPGVEPPSSTPFPKYCGTSAPVTSAAAAR